MILGVRACLSLSGITSRTRQTHRTPEPWPAGTRTTLLRHGFRRLYQSATRRAGTDFAHLQLHGPHDLRHTFSTWLEDAGIPARVIDELMGHHRSRRGELDGGSRIGARYRHTTDGMAVQVVEAIQERLSIALRVAQTHKPSGRKLEGRFRHLPDDAVRTLYTTFKAGQRAASGRPRPAGPGREADVTGSRQARALRSLSRWLGITLGAEEVLGQAQRGDGGRVVQFAGGTQRGEARQRHAAYPDGVPLITRTPLGRQPTGQEHELARGQVLERVELTEVGELVGVPAEFFLEFAIGGQLQRLIRLDHPTGESECLAVQGRRPFDRQQHVAVIVKGTTSTPSSHWTNPTPSSSALRTKYGLLLVMRPCGLLGR
jgi:Phage integrase family